ncbi:unnamed protein product [Cladocopium goreaui]|uniref:peptidylprolyl isomerase n=1 Tax=Cladocopium goreaui TaxID=2562237 RepID=A0A9P1C9V2_9DINO|nr:unnamed protein product [Cladocopium goreaui]
MVVLRRCVCVAALVALSPCSFLGVREPGSTSPLIRLRAGKRQPKEDLEVMKGFSVLVDFQMQGTDGSALVWKDVDNPLSFLAGGREVPEPLDSAVLGMVCGESKRLLAYGEPDEGGKELWEISNEKTDTCDLPLTLDITLLGIKVRQDSRGVVVQTVMRGDGITYPKSGDRISVHYTGKLASNGRKFDSTYDRQVIAGWDVALMKLSQGEKAVVTVPSALAYGPRGYGKLIPPNSDLIFEVHLVKVSRYSY